MLFFKRKKQEIRADTDTSILTFFGITGEITRESAMNIPTVSACINKIGETVSRLPIKLFCRKNESVSEIKNDSRIRLLNGETGDTLSNVDLWKAAAEDYFLGGGAWIFVNSEHLKVKSLHYVDSRNISIISNNNPIFKAFRVIVNGTEYYDFKFIKLLRKTRDGYTNIPIQQENSKILSAAYNSLMLENMMNSSGCKPGFLKSKNRLSTEAIKAIKDGYRKVYDNQETREKVLVLNDGVEFEPISSTAAELQMNENKKTNSVEICKLFGFPHTIIDGGASEDDNKKFISAVISFLNQIETELDRVLLLESEKEKGFYFAFDTKELTRGNVLERYQAYEIARRNNILQIDEIRREEDFKPLNFDFLTLNLSDVLINPQTMEVFTPNTGQSKNLITGEQRTLELRHNPNHDDKGRFCSGGGGGNSPQKSNFSLTNFLNNATINNKEAAFKKLIKLGKVNTTVEQSQQQKHQATKAWKNQVKQAVNSNGKQTPKSLLDKSIDPQKFVDKYAGTGRIEFPNSRTVVHEFITMPNSVGKTFDRKSGKYVSSKVIQIKYTEKGVHIFPTIEKGN